MSAIALLLVEMGHLVTGSDIRESSVVEQLRLAGVVITIGHNANVVHGVDVVVYSTAIEQTNIELVEAMRLNIVVCHRSAMLASLCAVIPTIGVAGTHGKTTTSALLTAMLSAGGLSPSSIIGAAVNGSGVGAHLGQGQLLVLEADESDGTLDVLGLEHLIITNVDVDHLDYFGTFENIQLCFIESAMNSRGHLVVNTSDLGSQPLLAESSLSSRVVRCGTAPSDDVQLLSANPTESGMKVTLRVGDVQVACDLPLRGVHNAMNLAQAVAMAWRLGIDPNIACTAVESFSGVARRFTERGTFRNALLVDDYAHLPAEISAAIAAVRSHPRRTQRVLAVFQPNRYHRIAAMSQSYADCFKGADHVVITDIYASGTTPIEGVTGKLVFDALVGAHPKVSAVWAPTRQNIIDEVAAWLQPGDVCISMGCGDIETFPDDLMKTVGN